MTTWTLQDSLELSVALVARDGHRVRLRGQERIEAIRAMATAGHGSAAMADRLCITADQVSRIARQHGIAIPRFSPWWMGLVAPSRSKPHTKTAA